MDKATTSVSIIIPVYNTEKYLSRCLDSVFYQTFTDYECILIDDGSFDNSSKICDDYVKKDKRFKVVHKKNEGLSVARNLGIAFSTGEYIFFLDSDDYLSVTTIEKLFSFIKANNLDIAEGRMVYSYENGNLLNYDNIKFNNCDSIILNTNSKIYDFFFNEYRKINAVNKLIKTNIIVNNNIRFIEGIISEDILWLYLYLLPKVENAGFVNCITYCYYKNNDKSITQSYSENHLRSYLFIIKQLMQDDYIYSCLVNSKNTLFHEYIFMAIKQYYMLDNIDNSYISEIKELIYNQKYMYFKKKCKPRYIIRLFLFLVIKNNNFIKYLLSMIIKLHSKK